MEEDKYQILINYALKLLSYRPRSTQEIRGKLMRLSIKGGINITFVNKVINDLTARDLLNDEAFSTWWIGQRDLFRPKGQRVLKIELMNKGIGKEIINSLFTKEENKNSERENALTIVQKKLPLYKNLSQKQIKIKLFGHLSRRGFDWETIYNVIDEVINK